MKLMGSVSVALRHAQIRGWDLTSSQLPLRIYGRCLFRVEVVLFLLAPAFY